MGAWRWTRLGLIGTTSVIGLTLLSGVGLVYWLGTPSGNHWIKRSIETAVSASMVEGAFEIDVLRTDILSRLDVEGLRIVDGLGMPLLEIPAARAQYDVSSLLTGPLHVTALEARGLRLVLDRGDDRLRLAELFGPSSGSTEPFSLPIDLQVDALRLVGSTLLIDESVRLEGGDVTATLATEGPVFRIGQTKLCAHLVVPGPLPLCADGPIVWDGAFADLSGLVVEGPGSVLALSGTVGSEINLDVDVGRLDLEGLDPAASRTGLRGTLAGRLHVEGPLSELLISGDLAGVEGTQGALKIAAHAEISDPIAWGADVQTLGIDVAQVYEGTPMPVVLDGRLVLEATGVKYPEALELDLDYRGRIDADSTYHLRDSVFVGQLKGGILTLTQGDFDGVAGPLGTTGSIDLVGGELRLDLDGQLSGEQLAELGVEGLLEDGLADLVLSTDLKRDGGRYRVAGSVLYEPFAYTPDVRMESLRVELSGWTQGADFAFRVGLQGEDGVAYGAGLEELFTSDLDVARTSAGLTARGPLMLDGLSLPGEGLFSTAAIDLDVWMPTEGEREITAHALLGAFDLQTFLGTGGRVDVEMVGEEVVFSVALEDGEREFLRTTGDYNLQTAELQTSWFEIAPTPRLAWTSNGPIRFRITEGGLVDSRISLRGLHGDLDLAGDLQSTGEVDGTLRVIGLHLDALAELFPDRFSGLSGVMTMNAQILGPASSPSINGRVDVDGLWVADTARWLDLEGTFVGEQGQMGIDLVFDRAGEPLGRLDGVIPMVLDLANPGLDPDGELDLDGVLLPGSLARLEEVSVADLGLPTGELSALLHLDGRLEDPAFELSGVLQTAVGNWRQPGRLEFGIERSGGGMDGGLVVREGLAERAVVTGSGTTRMGELFRSMFAGEDPPDTGDLRLWLDAMVLSAELKGIPAKSLNTAFGGALPLTGDVDGMLYATGDPYQPELDGELVWSEGSIAETPVEAVHLLLRPAEEGMELRADAAFSTGQMVVEGQLPIAVDLHKDASSWMEGPLDLHLEGAGLPLGLLAMVDGVERARGSLDIRGSIGGTLERPDLQLKAGVEEGAFLYEPLGLALSDLEMEVSGKGRRVTLERFVTHSRPLNPIGLLDENRPSLLQLTGAAHVDGGALEQLSATMSLRDAWVMGTYDTALRMDGDVRLSGEWPELNVDGELDLVNGRYVYRADDAVVASPLQPSDTLVIHRNGTPFRFREPDSSPLYAGFDIDLGIDLKRNLEVVAVTPFFDDLGHLTASLTQASVNARVGGELEVGLNPDASWRLGGELEVVDGTIQVLRTKFRLDNGRIVLVPYDVGTSPLDLSAASRLQDAVLDLRIAGTVNDPLLAATSEGHDETQVLVMLLTGRSMKGLTSNQGQAAQQDAAMAAAALITSSMLSGTAAGALSIEADGSIRIGAPWSASVFSELVLRPFADSDENLVSVAIEWALIRRLLLDAGAGDRYQWADISWETRF